MHISRDLRSSSFDIEVGGNTTQLEELFEDFGDQDRLGVVVRQPCGAVGASALITATVTAFYEIQRSRGTDFFIYPDYYLFHVGRPLGNHGMLDVTPDHKEVVVADDGDQILEAINDRGITRLVVEAGGGSNHEPDLAPRTLASARGRIVSCLAYSPGGRVAEADVRIRANPVTEGYVDAILYFEGHVERLRAEGEDEYADSIDARAGEVEREVRDRIRCARKDLFEDGAPVETYRRIELDEALAALG